MLRRLLLLFALSLLVLAARAEPARRVALLVGNQSYTVGALRFPVQDVELMREALLAVGFRAADVQVVTNADQKTLRRAVQQLGQRARGAEVAFLYYSGHGAQALGQNWLIPLGADLLGEADYELEAVSAQAVLTQLQSAAPKVSVVVLDACRDNPAAVSKSGSKGLGRMDAGSGTLIAFATAPNDTAADTGLYARTLSAQLRRPGLELLDVFRNTTAEVRKATNGRQVPRVSEVTLEDRVYLAGTAPLGPAPTPQVADAPTTTVGARLDDLQREDALRREWARWQTAMKSDYDTINAFTGSPDLRLKAWERFLAAWPQDNPFSREDEELRRLAAVAVSGLQAANKPAPKLEKVTFAADAYFDYDKVTLAPEVRAKLDELASKAKGVSLEFIIAVGHTDSREGTDAYTQQMSIRRAQAVKDYLVSQGVSNLRIYTEGKGRKSPVADNATPEGRAMNRRVGIEVVGMRPVDARN